MKDAIATKNAPNAVGPYSQAIVTDDLIFASGQIPLNPASGEIEGDTIEAQTKQVMKNIAGVLAADGLDFSAVVKTTVFLDKISDFVAFNGVYESFLMPPYPARSTVEVAALPKGAKVEIEVIAQRKK